MNRIATITTLAAILTVTAPLSGAEWYSQGSFEPDTYLDTKDYMPQDLPWTVGGDGKKTHTTAKIVYFNAFIKADTAGSGGNQNGGLANPNAALLHSRFDPAGPDYTYVALFGIWADCNLDGYIGLGEQGVREYPAQILTAQLAADQEALPDACKAPTSGADVWHGTHQQNGWVTELIPILGRQNFDAGRKNIGNDLRAYYDYDAAVWGDAGLPDDPATLRVVSQCHGFVRAQPFDRHYSYTTGSMLRAYDCEGTRGVLAAYNSVVGAANGDLKFDEKTTCSSCGSREAQNPTNPLDFSPWDRCWLAAEFKCSQKSDHWDNTFVRAQDCENSGSRLNPNNPLPAIGGQEGGYLYRPPSADKAVNPNGNIAGTHNRTTEEVDPIAGDQDEDDGETNSSNCNPNNEGVEPGKRDSGAGFYNRIEQNPNAATAGKNRATWNFESDAQARGNIPASVRWSGKANGAPTDFGIDAIQWVSCNALCSSATEMPYWGQASLTGGTLGYLPPTARDTDTTDNLTAQAKAAYITFYASIGADLDPASQTEPRITANQFTVPAGGTYGAAQCANWKATSTATQVPGGYTNVTEPTGSDWRVLQDRVTYPYFHVDFNWECNTRLWNVKSDGLWDDTDWREAVGGQKYDLRDVDCLDGTAYLDVDGEEVGFALSPASLRDPNPGGPDSTRCKTA